MKNSSHTQRLTFAEIAKLVEHATLEVQEVLRELGAEGADETLGEDLEFEAEAIA